MELREYPPHSHSLRPYLESKSKIEAAQLSHQVPTADSHVLQEKDSNLPEPTKNQTHEKFNINDSPSNFSQQQGGPIHTETQFEATMSLKSGSPPDPSDVSYKVLNEILNTTDDHQILKKKIQARLQESRKHSSKRKSLNNSNSFELWSLGSQSSAGRHIHTPHQQELQELDQQIFLTKQAIEGKELELETKRSESRRLQGTSNAYREQLSKQMGEAQEQLTKIKNKRVNRSSQEKALAMQENLKNIKEEIQRNQMKSQELDSKIQAFDSKMKQKEEEINAEYSKQHQALEVTLEDIFLQKQLVHQQLTEKLIEHDLALEQKALLKEDLNSHLLHRAELVGQREEIDGMLESMKYGPNNDIIEYHQEQDLKEELARVTKCLNEHASERRRLTMLQEEANKELSRLAECLYNKEREHRAVLKQKYEGIHIVSEQIDQIGGEIKVLMIKTGEQELNAIFERAAKLSVDNEKELLQRQLAKIEIEELRLVEKVQAGSRGKNEKDQKLLNQSNGNLNGSVDQAKLKNFLTCEVLSNCKKELQQRLASLNASIDPNEAKQIRQRFLSELEEYIQNRLPSTESQQTLRICIENFIVKRKELTRLELELDEEVIDHQNEKSNIEQRVKELSQHAALQSQKIREKDEEFSKMIIEKKNLEISLNEKKTLNEHKLLAEAEASFNAYAAQQSAMYDNISRTYGSKALKNVKQEHFKEFVEFHKSNQQMKIVKYQQLKSELRSLDNSVKVNIKTVDEEILPSLKRVLQTITEQSEMIKVLKKQQITLLEKEDGLAWQLNTLQAKKIKMIEQEKQQLKMSAGMSNSQMKERRTELETRVRQLQAYHDKLEAQIASLTNPQGPTSSEERELNERIKLLQTKLSNLTLESDPRMLEELGDEVKVTERELSTLRRNLEKLEFRKLALEQKVIEESYIQKDDSFTMGNMTMASLNMEKLNMSQTFQDEFPRNNRVSDLNKSMDAASHIEGKKGRHQRHSSNVFEMANSFDNKRFENNRSVQNEANLRLSHDNMSKIAFANAETRKAKEGAGFASFEKHQRAKSVAQADFTGLLGNEENINPANKHAGKARAGNNHAELNLPLQQASFFRNPKLLNKVSQELPLNTIAEEGFCLASTLKKKSQDTPYDRNNRRDSMLNDSLMNAAASEELEFEEKQLKKRDLISTNLPTEESNSSFPQGHDKPPASRNNKLSSQENSRVYEDFKSLHNYSVNQTFCEGASEYYASCDPYHPRRELQAQETSKFAKSSLSLYASQPHQRSSSTGTGQRAKENVNILNESFARLNSHLESKVRTRTGSLAGTHSREPSIGLKAKNIFKLNTQNCSLQEIQFFEKVKPLLEGACLFKRFSNYTSLKKAAFDPLNPEENPPESCGYGMRHIRLNKDFDKFEIRHAFKPGVEAILQLENFVRPVVPQITTDILKIQKRLSEDKTGLAAKASKLNHSFEVYGHVESKNYLLQRNGDLSLEQYLGCTHYPFSILLEKGGRIDFIAPSYQDFRQWIDGLNMLIKNKRNLAKLKHKIEVCQMQIEI